MGPLRYETGPSLLWLFNGSHRYPNDYLTLRITSLMRTIMTLRIKVGWDGGGRWAVGGIFTAESSIHLVFGDLTIQMHLATTKISSEISCEHDIVHGELISLYIIFKWSLVVAKHVFYRAANVIFGKVGRAASEEVIIQLILNKWTSPTLDH